jgi:pimeloyl-ACP methyl ester carboxylesterase
MQVNVRGVDVHYVEHGAGRPVVLIHGFMADHRLMAGCMEPVFAQMPGYRRIYVDLPGMGETKGADWIRTSDDMLDLVMEFIDAVLGQQRFLIAGQSYGGYLARAVVRRARERVDGLMLLCPVVVAAHAGRTVPAHKVLERDEAVAQLMNDPDVRDTLMRDFDDIAVVQTACTWRRAQQEVAPGLELANRRFLARLRNRGYAFTRHPPVDGPPFDKPALILVGRQDASVGYVDAWPLLEQYPRASFAVLDRAGHRLQMEQPILFEALVTDWLHRTDESARAAGNHTAG